MEFNEKVPSTLIRQSSKFVFEPPDGIKASLKRSYQTVITASRSDKGPAERSRLHFLLSWVHAVILERLRYTPIGWTKVYDFNEADQRCALDLVDELIDSFGECNNLSPDKIPWEAIRTILCQALYGGKIDNDFDSKILTSLAEQFFTPRCFDHDFSLFDTLNKAEVLMIPDVSKTSQFVEWINNLPAVESPAWSGLPVKVEKVLKEQQTEYLLSRIWQIQDANEEAVVLESVTETKKAVKKEGTQQLKWLRELGEKANMFIQILPSTLEKLSRTSGSITNPLFRFLEREVTVASKLLNALKANLGDVKNLCEGKIQSTADLRKLALQLYADEIPTGWKKYRVANLSVSDWLTDFKKRLDQFNRIIPQKEYHRHGVWMGGLLFPEAYLTATRQAIAQSHQWSLEELEMKVMIYHKEELDEDSFLVSGLFIEGAQWDADSKQLALSEEMRFVLPTLKFTWVRVNKADKGVVGEGEILVPVYLNKSRANLLFSIKLYCGKIPRTTLYQKGIALICCEN